MFRMREALARFKYRFATERGFRVIVLTVPIILLVGLLYVWLKPAPPKVPDPPTGSLRQGLVAYWGFDERSGQVARDASGNGNHLRFGGSDGQDAADPAYTQGKHLKALQFDGSDDYLVGFNRDQYNITDAITMAGWVNIEGTASDNPTPVWMSGFQYRRPVTIDTTESSEAFNDVQLPVTLDTASLIEAGKMQPDCSDLRFTTFDETTPVPYWIESGCNTNKTSIWVKLSQVPARREMRIYAYYGNQDVTEEQPFASSYERTMEVPPVQWWQFPRDKEDRRVLHDMTITSGGEAVTVGSGKGDNEGAWWTERIGANGFSSGRGATDWSETDDVARAVAAGPDGMLAVGGSDGAPGTLQWTGEKSDDWTFRKDYSGGSDEIRGAAVDAERNVIFAGYDSVPGDARWRAVKFNSEGEVLWDYTANPSGDADIIVDAAVDSQNNIILAGYEKGVGNDQWRVDKLTPEGELEWSWRLDFSDQADVVNGVAVDDNDNILVAGYDLVAGSSEWRVAKLSPDGSRQWWRSDNRSGGPDEATDVAVDLAGNIVVVGFDSSPGDKQWVVRKFASDGTSIWEWATNPSSGRDILTEVAVDDSGNILVGGTAQNRDNPQWQVAKISERKSVSKEPEITVESEESVDTLSRSTVIAKPEAYRLQANARQAVGFFGNNPIAATMPTTEWHHVAVTYDGTTQRLYINGEQVNRRALSGQIDISPKNIFVGYNYNGLIDELMLYNRALSASEVEQLYNRRN